MLVVDQNREHHKSVVDWIVVSEADTNWCEGAKMVGAIFKTCEATWKQVSKISRG